MPIPHNRYLNNLSLKILALVFGYTMWKTMSDGHKAELARRIPVSFYNEQGLIIESPDSLAISLSGTRSSLYTLTRNLAVHIDATRLQEGTNTIVPDEQLLFLPEQIKLLHCTPSALSISITKS